MASSDESSIIIPKQFIFSHLMFHRERGDITRVHWENNDDYSPKRIKKDLIVRPIDGNETPVIIPDGSVPVNRNENFLSNIPIIRIMPH
jgi:hypothetical protein